MATTPLPVRKLKQTAGPDPKLRNLQSMYGTIKNPFPLACRSVVRNCFGGEAGKAENLTFLMTTRCLEYNQGLLRKTLLEKRRSKRVSIAGSTREVLSAGSKDLTRPWGSAGRPNASALPNHQPRDLSQRSSGENLPNLIGQFRASFLPQQHENAELIVKRCGAKGEWRPHRSRCGSSNRRPDRSRS
jgi:hypothetical protein